MTKQGFQLLEQQPSTKDYKNFVTNIILQPSTKDYKNFETNIILQKIFLLLV